MPRLMSCALTTDAVKGRTKTVTRRHAESWKPLKPGDRLTLVEKGQGIPKGGKVVRLAEVEVVSVRVEPLSCLIERERNDGLAKEGLPGLTWGEFAAMWLRSHGYKHLVEKNSYGGDTIHGWETPCRRIEWRYLNEAAK
jgi:hypothetical protein